MLEKLLKRQREILARLRALNEGTAEGATIRAMTDAETEEYGKLEAELGTIEQQIARAEKLEKAEAEERARETTPTKPAPNLTVIRNERHDEKGEYRGFSSFGEQLQCVARAALGETPDKRIGEIRAAAGIAGVNDSEAGLLVQTDFAGRMFEKVFEQSQLASLCDQKSISSASNEIEYLTVKETSRARGSRNGGATVTWIGEAGTIAQATKPEFEINRLKLEKAVGLQYVTDEMLADAAFLGPWLEEQFSDEFAIELDLAIFEGDGAGKPKGFAKNADALVVVAKESGQAADSIVAANILKMWSCLPPRWRSGAAWLINPFAEAVLPQMTIGQQPVYLPAGGLTGKQYATLLGAPVIPFEGCEKLGDQNDLMLVNLKRGYLLITKGGIKADQSIHVKFDTAQIAFRFQLRVNGQSKVRSKITPLKGNTGDAYSAYVTLAARS